LTKIAPGTGVSSGTVGTRGERSAWRAGDRAGWVEHVRPAGPCVSRYRPGRAHHRSSAQHDGAVGTRSRGGVSAL